MSVDETHQYPAGLFDQVLVAYQVGNGPAGPRDLRPWLDVDGPVYGRCTAKLHSLPNHMIILPLAIPSTAEFQFALYVDTAAASW